MNSITGKTSSELLKELDELIKKDIQACYKDLEQLKKSTIFEETKISSNDQSFTISETQNTTSFFEEDLCEQ